MQIENQHLGQHWSTHFALPALRSRAAACFCSCPGLFEVPTCIASCVLPLGWMRWAGLLPIYLQSEHAC